MLKLFTITVAIAIGLLIMLFIIGTNVSPEESRAYDKRRAAQEMCDQMMSDAALGNERRMTREICDGLMKKADEDVDNARFNK